MKRLCIIIIVVVLALLTTFSFALTAHTNGLEIYRAQKALKDLGYNPGKLDEIWGKATQRALERFQGDIGLPVTGRLDGQTKMKL